MPRPRLDDSSGGSYFASPKEHIEFISTGCRLLDCVIGGGWVLGRVGNIVGDKSTGKTLLAIEAAANFAAVYDGPVRYREAEAAFDIPYAGALGMPLDRVDFGDPDKPIHTVEELFDDLSSAIKESTKSKEASLYVVDSLDALSDTAEMDSKITDGTYGTGKAKMMSRMFRQLIGDLEKSKMCLLIISQVRDKIGFSMGRKTSRSGGHALDFYASQVVYLSHLKTLKRTVNKVERPYGISIGAKCDKNKIGLPYRDCEFDILFGFGIDDLVASIDWLTEVGRLGELDWDGGKTGVVTKENRAAFLKDIESLPDDEFRAAVAHVGDKVAEVWQEIETSFMPTRRKY